MLPKADALLIVNSLKNARLFEPTFIQKTGHLFNYSYFIFSRKSSDLTDNAQYCDKIQSINPLILSNAKLNLLK